MDASQPKVTYRFMIILTLVVGVIGVPLLLLPDFDLLSIVLSCAVLGGLIGGQAGYEERDRQRLQRGYKRAFEWMILVLLASFAFIASSQWFGLGGKVVEFLNNHWPSLILSMMCVLLGIAGLRNFSVDGSA